MNKPQYVPSIKRELIVTFAMASFNEPRDIASKRVRKTSWGYLIKDPLPDSYGNIPLGPGPIVVHGDTGEYVSLSSNPDDMFGRYGFTSLKNLEDLNFLISNRGSKPCTTIFDY